MTPSSTLATTWTTTTETLTEDLTVVTSYTKTVECHTFSLVASHGETITFHPPSTTTVAVPTTKALPTYTFQPTVTSTTTETQFVVYLQDTTEAIYSTWTIDVTSPGPSQVSSGYPDQYVYTVAGEPTGWDSWSKGEKAGLIVGVVFAALLIALLLLWLLKRNDEWIGHDWRWARHVEGGANPGMNVVPTVTVNGPLNPAYATPYGYGFGQGHPGWGYGMRGGDGERDGFGQRVVDWAKDCWRREDIAEAHVAEIIKGKKGQDNSNTITSNGEERSTQRLVFYRPLVTQKDKHIAPCEGNTVRQGQGLKVGQTPA